MYNFLMLQESMALEYKGKGYSVFVQTDKAVYRYVLKTFVYYMLYNYMYSPLNVPCSYFILRI